jgi:hypothetical protein
MVVAKKASPPTMVTTLSATGDISNSASLAITNTPPSPWSRRE